MRTIKITKAMPEVSLLLITPAGVVSRSFAITGFEDQIRVALKAYPTWKLVAHIEAFFDVTEDHR